eukprot:Sdes_comp20938_c0_seq2m18411
MLTNNQLEFLMEAHNGLSAKIVQETGFKGIWGSGLSISAALGVRDSNEASYTQILEVLEFMSDQTDIPILLDADTGYGNFNNARRLVRKLETRGIAGMCIEDKLFPKTNSLLEGRSQPLADPKEFALKITACKDAQTDPNFCVVARVEAFIAGWGLEEALARASAYVEAGADAVLIHSKKDNPSDIQAFMKSWNHQGENIVCNKPAFCHHSLFSLFPLFLAPVVIVPTKYYQTPTDDFRKLGISTVIWANHNLRACVTAIQNTSKSIYENQSLVGVEKKIASVKEVFRLQNDSELKSAKKKYLPS